MKTHTSQFKEQIKKLGRELDSKITYTLNNEEVVLGKEQLNAITPHYEGDILKSVMKQLDIDSNVDIPVGTEINYQFGVKVGNSYEYLDYGNYIIYSTEKQEDTRSYKIVCYDKMLYAMKDYEKLVSKNLFDKNNVNILNAKYGNTITEDNNERMLYIPCEPNTTYTLYHIATTPMRNSIGTTQTTPEIGTTIEDGVYSSTSPKTITTNANARYIVWQFYAMNDTQHTLQEILDSIQIEKGNQSTNYVPYFQYPITLKNYLLCLCDKIGLTLKDTNFVNYNQEIVNELYLDSEGNSLNYTYRDVLDEIAGATASTICINEDDELEVRYINATQGRNYFDNSKPYTYQTINNYLETTIPTGKRITWTSSTNLTYQFLCYAVMDLTDYVGKTIRFRTDFSVSGSNTGSYYIGLCNADGTNRNVKANANSTSGQTLSFVVPTLSGQQKYLCVALYVNTTGTLAQNDYVDFTNIMLTIDDSDMTFEPYGADLIDEEYLKDINVNFGEKYGPVNSVVFSRSAESDNIYRQDETSITNNGLHEIKIIDNQILNSNNRENFIDGVFNQLNGFEYYANDFSSTGIAYYDLCDRYNVKVENNIYSCIMMNDELDITQGLEEKVHLDIPEKSETDYKKADTTDRRVNQAWLMVNKQEQTIEGLVSKTSVLDGGVYTKEQVDNLLIDSQNGLTNTFSEAGGNNIFRNTGLWFTTTDEDNPYEFWNGVAIKQKEEKASNMSAILLQNGNFVQEQLVPNGFYTVSFKYKKLIELSNPKVFINDIEYELSETDETEFIQILEVSSQHINVRFNCDINNGCEIYDLMINAGQVKLAYSQNQNETTTDTVNISKGITITSSDLDVTFKANADGIRTLDNSNNVITQFTDTGMTTKRAIIQEKSEIVGTIWQEVGEQTWITRL